jgi:FkbM family methyltransferase
MPELVAEGTYDVPFTAFVREYLQPGNVAIDVGAHVGLFTLLMAYEVWKTGHVIAYEANPHNLRLLRDNVTMNYLDDRVEIVPCAAGAAAGSAEFLGPAALSDDGLAAANRRGTAHRRGPRREDRPSAGGH